MTINSQDEINLPEQEEMWELRLYVAGKSPKSLLAIANLQRICKENLDGRYRIEVIDLVEHHPSGFVGPAFRVQGLYVWGFTAGLLARVLHLAGVELGWDATPTEDLPDDIMALLP